jgi:hypothetical protein
MPGLGVEDLHPGVEVTHVRVGPVDKRLNLGIDGGHDIRREEIVDDDGPVLQERPHNLTDRVGRLSVLESTVFAWCHGLPRFEAPPVCHGTAPRLA